MKAPQPVLALDIATVTGWCVGVPGGAPLLGSVRLEGNGVTDGALGCALIDWLSDRIGFYDPSLVVYEAPLPGGQHSSINAGRIALGLVTATQIVCWRRRVRCVPANVNTVRAKVLGNGHSKKPEVAAWCTIQGWTVPMVGGSPDLDATDAAVLWAYQTGMRHQPPLRLRP
jgi:hypothetical protein